MKRKCDCSGGCGPQGGDVSRREFMEVVAIGAAGAALGGSSAAAAASPQQAAGELARWTKALHESSPPRVYRSDVHTDARLHLGGIGTGNVEIGVDGQLTTWQLFNTLRDGHVPFHFAVHTGQTTKLLQTKGGLDRPRVERIEMTGEYPLATLRFHDVALPVGLELTAFTPFAPLDTALSSAPMAAFVFRVHNPTDHEQTVSLAALMTNPVGYDAAGTIEGVTHPNFGGNVNEVFHQSGATGLVMRAEAGQDPTLDRAVTIATLPNLRGLRASASVIPKELHVEVLDRGFPRVDQLADPAHTVLWLEDAPADLPVGVLRAVRRAVEAGATLVFSGRHQPLLKTFGGVTGGKPLAQAGGGRRDIVFEDFENGYTNWTVEGTAFGGRPASGTLPGQQTVSGFHGRGLVNSFRDGDDTTGRLVSKPFTIERSFIRFLVGGGSFPTTQVRLVVGGKTVRASAGHDNERLEPASWSVGDLVGKTAHIEIVDAQTGGWGHINVDQIELSDQVGDRATLEVLDEILPGRFRDLRPEPVGLELKPEATRSTLRSGLKVLERPLGKGHVVVALGAILDPAEAELAGARHRAFAALCALVGAEYKAPRGVPAKAPGFGSLALATTAAAASVELAGDDLNAAFTRFAADGQFDPADPPRNSQPTAPGRTVNGAVAARVTVAPGQTVEVPFLLTWHYPNKYNGAGIWMGCHYATHWPDAAGVMRDVLASFAAARGQTERFHTTFYDSTLPYWLLDCLTSQAAIIRHIGVVFRLASGDVFGWEGSNGCCQPTCTHVWGYEQTLSRLFPDLERMMRRIDFVHQQRKDGGVNNRTDVPSPPRPTGEQPFADGHASCILKAYREALNSPDDTFFKTYWPPIKKAVDYLIARDAATAGGQPSGVLRDDQWNTYDEALHGVTTFISGYYLAALRAGEEWARRVGDGTTADRFHTVFLKGRKYLVDHCWNGEYFQQELPDYLTRPGEVGPGCMADQLIGQWWAHQLGLGYILPREHVVKALRSVFQYNWKSDLTGWKHMPRAFAGAKDKGLIICTWPKGGRPGQVMLYSDEVWTGIEYQVAAHMIYEGLLEEGLAIVKGARDRYDGIPRPPIPRNPWNEIECGGHYARAMSSWSLLLAASGYEYDGPARSLRFTPRLTPANFKAFFCGPEGWGSLRQNRGGGVQRNQVAVTEGTLAVATLRLASDGKPHAAAVTVAGVAVPCRLQANGEGVLVTLEQPVAIKAGQALEVVLS